MTCFISEARHTPGALLCGMDEIQVLTDLLPNSWCSLSLLLICNVGVSFRRYLLWESGEQHSEVKRGWPSGSVG